MNNDNSTGNSEMRFSDVELHKFYAEFRTHVRETKADRAVTVQTMAELKESTEGLISAWEAIQGTVKVFSVLGKFSLWIVSLTGIIMLLDWIRNYTAGGNS